MRSFCGPSEAQESLQQHELAAAYAFKAQYLGPTRARHALQVAGDLRRPESIHYVLLPQTMQHYLAPTPSHDLYMDLRTVVQNNLARKGPDPAGAEELRYENVFLNLITGSADLVVKVMFAVAIDDVIFIVMSSLAIRLMIFKIFPAWMMKAPMAGVGLFLTFIGLHSGKWHRPHPRPSQEACKQWCERRGWLH